MKQNSWLLTVVAAISQKEGEEEERGGEKKLNGMSCSEWGLNRKSWEWERNDGFELLAKLHGPERIPGMFRVIMDTDSPLKIPEHIFPNAFSLLLLLSALSILSTGRGGVGEVRKKKKLICRPSSPSLLNKATTPNHLGNTG